jgi:hypothetical protein
MKKIFFLFILWILFFNITYAEETYFSPSTIGQMEAQVKIFGTGTISELKPNQVVKLQIITFQKTSNQNIEILRETVFINNKAIPANPIYDEFDNKYAEFIIPENGEFTYELIANVKTQSIIQSLPDFNLTNTIEVSGDYLNPTLKIESDSSEILTLVKNKFIKNSFIDTLNDIVSWTNDYVEYAQDKDFQKYYILQQSALETLNDKKGVCDEFANLSAAILRAKKIPTRIAIGVTFDGKEWGNHAWIEIYHPSVGWIASDPTFRESGFVDATHIKMGAFNDVSLSLAKALFPSNAKVSFGPPTLPEVVIIKKNYFDKIELDAKAPTIYTNQWNTIPVQIKNLTNNDLTIPILFNKKYNELYIKNPRIDLIIKGNETKMVEFEIYADVNLQPNQFATGQGLILNSLGTPIELEFQIKHSPPNNQGTVEVMDISPIVSGKNLNIEIILSNFTSKKTEIELKIIGNGNDLNEIITLDKLEFPKRITKTIPSFQEETYTIEIITPTAKYTQIINPIQPKQKIIIEDKNKNQAITQKIDLNKTPKPFTITLESPLFIIILVIVLIIITLTTTYYFSQKTRYI